MLIHVVKSKIHRVKVTGAELNYIGSITIDQDLLDAANIVEGEKVQVVNNNNGERLETMPFPGQEAVEKSPLTEQLLERCLKAMF